MSLKENLLARIKAHHGWFTYRDIESLCKELGYKPSNGERRCRDLRREELVESRTIGRLVEYKAVNTGSKLADRVNELQRKKQQNTPNTLF